MKIKTIPLSMKDGDSIDRLKEIYDKILPIGVGYKKYLDSDKDFRDYFLVINTHNELNIHLVKGGVLNPSESTVIPEFSLEYLIHDATTTSMISKILDIQLNAIMDHIESIDSKVDCIIYLENSTDYMNYFNKTDKFILTDQFWKIHEMEQLKLMSGLKTDEE